MIAIVGTVPAVRAAAPWIVLAEGPVPGMAGFSIGHPRPLAGDLPAGVCFELSRGAVPLGWIHRAFPWDGKLYYSRCSEAETAASASGPLDAELLYDLEYTFVENGRVRFGRVVLPQVAFGARPAPRPPLVAYLANRSGTLYAVVYDIAKRAVVAEALFVRAEEGTDPAMGLPEPQWEPSGKAVLFPRATTGEAPLRLPLE